MKILSGILTSIAIGFFFVASMFAVSCGILTDEWFDNPKNQATILYGLFLLIAFCAVIYLVYKIKRWS